MSSEIPNRQESDNTLSESERLLFLYDVVGAMCGRPTITHFTRLCAGRITSIGMTGAHITAAHIKERAKAASRRQRFLKSKCRY
jgi:hypothetical protein